ncbi:hypothetical protein J2X90_001991 [Variovorax paradoxus]|uniref:hypothetical protein n=1 Tax=Variovorax paradoxus TaxID=34073 RepID=UPI002788D957|nr:hypothetical protein [Variovorax paradoxus]MDQ0024196.1 hypothetical protein [Variovorax paradoxus]
MTKSRTILSVLLAGLSFAGSSAQAAQPDPPSRFECGGELESAVWRRWDSDGKRLLESLVSDRLVKQGDTYALYDFEIYFHNLLSMAQRCRRIDRQTEFASWISKTYAQLSATRGRDSSLEWVCRGGSVCNDRNRLVNKEVMLTSVQFLALAMSAANGLDRSSAAAEHKAFIAETSRIAIHHLQRWNDSNARRSLQRRVAAKASDVKDGSSALFLSDKDIWQLVIYAELAGVLAQHPEFEKELRADSSDFAPMREHVKLLLELFKARTSLMTVKDPAGRSTATVADLDRGFWRLYVDNRYAAYNDKKPPLRCTSNVSESGRQKMQVLVEAQSLQPAETVGWDISHARRLVHFFDAIERNRQPMQALYGAGQDILPDGKVVASFARQLRTTVWNQDTKHPLFTNYYSGANGWYRVAYDNGANRCTEGTPPFGLSGAFPTGGYATWERWDEMLGTLGRQLYELTRSTSETDIQFIKASYPQFSGLASGDVRARSELMFWPTLVK